MGLSRIILALGRGDTALGRRRAGEIQVILGYQNHIAMLRRLDRRPHPRHPTPDHQHIRKHMRQELRAKGNQVPALIKEFVHDHLYRDHRRESSDGESGGRLKRK